MINLSDPVGQEGRNEATAAVACEPYASAYRNFISSAVRERELALML